MDMYGHICFCFGNEHAHTTILSHPLLQTHTHTHEQTHTRASNAASHDLAIQPTSDHVLAPEFVDPEFSHEDKAVASFHFSAKPMKSKSPSLSQIQRTEWPLITEVDMTPGFSSATPYWM